MLAFYAGDRLLMGPDGSMLPRANVLESGIGMFLGHAYIDIRLAIDDEHSFGHTN